MCIKHFLAVAVLVLSFQDILACKGYKARVIKVENCAGTDGVITIDQKFSVTLTEKCEFVPKGCIKSKDFSIADATYKVQKDGIIVAQGKADLCKLAGEAKDQSKDMLKLFGAPAKCPVTAEEVCSNDQKIDFAQHKSLLTMMKGVTIVDTEVEHDTGKSCLHVEMEITK